MLNKVRVRCFQEAGDNTLLPESFFFKMVNFVLLLLLLHADVDLARNFIITEVIS